MLIAYAWDVGDQNLTGAPAWFESTYDIDAVASGPGEMGAEELRPKVTSLLQDRMKPAAHKEQRQVTIYGRTVAPGDLKLKPSASDAVPERHPDLRTKVIDKNRRLRSV